MTAAQDALDRYLRAGASRRILEEVLRATRPVPRSEDVDAAGDDSGGAGGLLGGILRLASNLDRPAGAVRSTILGKGPVEGFKNPEDYSLVDPNDSPFMRFLGGAAESILDPLNLVGAKWMSPLARESSFAKKFAAEASVNLAAREGSQLASDAIPDDASPWLQGLGPIGAGFGAGAAVGGGIAGVSRRGGGRVEAPRPDTATPATQTRPPIQTQPPQPSSLAQRFASMTDDELEAINQRGTGAIVTDLDEKGRLAIRHMGLRRLSDDELESALRKPVENARALPDIQAELDFRRSGLARGAANQQPPPAVPLEQQLEMNFPEAVFADRTSPTPNTLEDAITTQEDNARIAAFAAVGKPMREAAENAAHNGSVPPIMQWNDNLAAAAEEFEARLTYDSDMKRILAPESGYDKLQHDLAQDLFRKTKERLERLPPELKIPMVRPWMAQTINGRINRSPLAHAASAIGHSYNNAQMAGVAEKRHNIGLLRKELFGDFIDKTTFKDTAPQSVRQGFTFGQAAAMQGKNGELNWLPLSIVVRNREHFNLSPDQTKFLDDVEAILKADNDLSRDLFGVPITEMDNAYDPRSFSIVHADDTPLSPDEQIRLLGGKQSYQFHRMFEKPEEIALAAANPEHFRQHLKTALEAAVRNNAEPNEINRLTDLYNSQIKIQLNPKTFEDAIADRLAQAANARSERFVLKTLRNNGATVKEIHEMESLIGSSRITEAISVPAEVASTLRQLTLSLDASILGTHAIGEAVMGHGLKGLINEQTGGVFRAVTSSEGWGRFLAANAKEMARLSNGGLELGTDDFIVPDNAWLHRAMKVGVKNVVDPTTGKATPVRAGGTDVNLLGKAVRGLDELQYGRMVKIWKMDVARHVEELMLAARDNKMSFTQFLSHPMIGLSSGSFKKMTDDELLRAATQFSNNLFGGLNRVEEGRTAVHNLLESLFVLTPGFTRGTLNIGLSAINPLKWDAQAALARDFTVRGIAMAGTIMTGIAMAFGLEAPNVTDPSKNDWMTLKFSDGKEIKPLARWRSSGKIVGTTAQTWAEAGPIEAAQYFGPAAARWATGRQSGLISGVLGDPVGDIAKSQFGRDDLGNPYTSNLGLMNILTNPETDQGRQIGEAVVRAGMPATAQNVLEVYREDGSLSAASLHNVGFTIATEFFGVNSQAPTLRQQSILAKGADWAANHGMAPELIQEALAQNRNPITYRDETGRYVLDSATRRKGVEALSAELGMTTDQIYRNGDLSPREKRAELEAIKNNQINAFFEGMEIADANYADKMGRIQEGVNRGLFDYTQVSSLISEARKARSAEKGMVEQLNPAALAFLQSPDQLAKKNSRDLLMSAISAEFFSKDFYDPETLSFDYDAQTAWTAELRNKYGVRFDEWQRNNEAKKTPLERERDAAFDRLDQYFRVGQEIWQQSTGGVLGQNEAEFDRSLRQMFKEGGIEDPGTLTYLIATVKSNLAPVKFAKDTTSKLRDIMRASDPQLEDDVTKWLGNTPIEVKSMSKARRAYINQLLLKQTYE